jgi:hypothetical protein
MGGRWVGKVVVVPQGLGRFATMRLPPVRGMHSAWGCRILAAGRDYLITNVHGKPVEKILA